MIAYLWHKRIMKKIIFIALISFTSLVIAQETVGLVYNNLNELKSDGYTLIKPTSDDRVFLINNCGEVLNQWDSSIQDSRNVYLLENGHLLHSSGTNAEIRDWDNNVLWSIDYLAQLGFRIHHDIEPLPNGNYLVLVRDVYSNTELFAEGLDTSYSLETMVLERIVEIEPVGTNAANIVWEWKLFDHIVQEFDSSKPNFQVVSDNPQLLNINYDNGNGSNPIHANAIDYNENLDQIAISARHLSEVFIIDHTTTTLEASGHSGGVYGKGGDFLWRWGNPEVYDNGTLLDKKLGRQHDIKWIKDGPHQGKMSVFSNDGYGTDTAASSIHIIDQSGTDGVYTLSSGKFLPENYFWSWDGTIMNEIMHGGAQCGVQIMPNGNALINESDIGRISEVDGSGNLVWVYIIPVGNNSDFAQFTEPIGNGSFRAHRYSENYLGFSDVVFDNIGIIEDVNSISTECASLLSIFDIQTKKVLAYPNPTKNIVYFNFPDKFDKVEVYDLSGRRILNKTYQNYVNLENLKDDMYLIKVTVGSNTDYIKVLKI